MGSLERLAEIASEISKVLDKNEVTSIEAVLAVAMVLGKAQDDGHLLLTPPLAEAVRDFVAATYKLGH